MHQLSDDATGTQHRSVLDPLDTRPSRRVSSRSPRSGAGGPVKAPRPGVPRTPDGETLGGHAARQVLRLCEAAGLGGADSAAYARTLLTALGPAGERRLDEPPPEDSFLSDDHTPVEFSLAFVPDAPPTLRVLLEPGFGAGSLERNGRVGLRVVREMARRWGFDTRRLDELEDLFFPEAPEGPLALWCALELVPGAVPKVKVYLNPAASGQKRSAETVREALRRLGHRQAFAALPEGDRHLFFALDLGDWEEPRVKVYLAHHDLSAAEAAGLSRMDGGPERAEIKKFFRTAAGHSADGAENGAGRDPRLDRRPVQSCHAFTETATGLPSGFTLYVPVRDYARHDGEALDRAVSVLERYGIDSAPLVESLSAVTSRPLREGVGLIAYLGLAHQQGKPARVTVYVSSEAYAVRPPAGAPAAWADAVL
ncbi:DMATS family aromatic prenyltransferase [Streptomyces sp. NBC_00249]|uniref:DMATS family aromatic prenyltransferase n=1 Tax=Streptomyces sp. NBC_00249 TaxID=2975690 RepID=UPI002255E786|nr:DMATS family aromatic prenyltransferase [Streptomyces sp. NBC_00249]MCX5197389.1 DMATS family aromatic prenyltransferase [Streptomyces sp. NBC_00249]